MQRQRLFQRRVGDNRGGDPGFVLARRGGWWPRAHLAPRPRPTGEPHRELHVRQHAATRIPRRLLRPRLRRCSAWGAPGAGDHCRHKACPCRRTRPPCPCPAGPPSPRTLPSLYRGRRPRPHRASAYPSCWVCPPCLRGPAAPHVAPTLLLPRAACNPGDCGTHGVCLDDQCHCVDGYSGPRCSQEPTYPCGQSGCGDHGRCEDRACTCVDGYSGDHCDSEGPARAGGGGGEALCSRPLPHLLPHSAALEAAQTQRPARRRRHHHGGHDIEPATRQVRAGGLQCGRQHAPRLARGRQRGKVALCLPCSAQSRGGRDGGLSPRGGRVHAGAWHLPVSPRLERQRRHGQHGRACDADCDGG